MSEVLEREKCKQCGYVFGDLDFDCRTSEWEFSCRRCGYVEFLDMIADGEGNGDTILFMASARGGPRGPASAYRNS
jgi:predicted nucleic-acid-binding Zn-ribbon protein